MASAEMAGSVTEPVGTVTPAGETEPPKESVQPGHTAGPKNSIKPKPTVTPVPGRLVHKKYTTRYVYKGGKKLKKSFLTLKKKTYYFDKNGDMYHGWLKRGGAYYYLDRSTGVLVHHGKADGIRIRKGQAVQTKLSVRKIETMRTAARLLMIYSGITPAAVYRNHPHWHFFFTRLAARMFMCAMIPVTPGWR
mgnify:CR=1 FL=1